MRTRIQTRPLGCHRPVPMPTPTPTPSSSDSLVLPPPPASNILPGASCPHAHLDQPRPPPHPPPPPPPPPPTDHVGGSGNDRIVPRCQYLSSVDAAAGRSTAVTAAGITASSSGRTGPGASVWSGPSAQIPSWSPPSSLERFEAGATRPSIAMAAAAMSLDDSAPRTRLRPLPRRPLCRSTP
ncbi:hypothetical protein GGR56DRAFT_471333 [Xylariaceae sp. FL0804]|nr:hypothetical protein GGR56DRAFT_471333 [Xylariaceae sp. FL0804]